LHRVRLDKTSENSTLFGEIIPMKLAQPVKSTKSPIRSIHFTLIFFLISSAQAFELGSLFLFDIKSKAEGEAPGAAGRILIDTGFFTSGTEVSEKSSASAPQLSFSTFASAEDGAGKAQTAGTEESEFVIDFRVLQTSGSQGSFPAAGGLGGSAAKQSPEAEESVFDLGPGSGGSMGFGF
jgi:hypothetical protein